VKVVPISLPEHAISAIILAIDLGEFNLVSPHRKKEPTSDGRRLRRYKRRWKVERTFAWLHSYRRVMTRHERRVELWDGFVHLACAFIALKKLL
jgi:transposase